MSNLPSNSLQEGEHNLQEMKTKSPAWSSKGYHMYDRSRRQDENMLCSFVALVFLILTKHLSLVSVFSTKYCITESLAYTAKLSLTSLIQLQSHILKAHLHEDIPEKLAHNYWKMKMNFVTLCFLKMKRHSPLGALPTFSFTMIYRMGPLMSHVTDGTLDELPTSPLGLLQPLLSSPLAVK